MKEHRKLTLPVLLLAAACLFASVSPSLADRDIVYSARYYLRPGSTGLSHSHLYRINPDGTRRTQITFGKPDDYVPFWSPNGRWIVFRRVGIDRSESLYLCRSDGSDVHKLIGGGQSDLESGIWKVCMWSPDSRVIAVTHEVLTGFGDNESTYCAVYLIDRRSGRYQRIPGQDFFCWSPDGRKADIETQTSDVVVRLKKDLVPPGQLNSLGNHPDQGSGIDYPVYVWVDADHRADLDDDSTNKAASIDLDDTDGNTIRTVKCVWPGSGRDPFDIEDEDQGQDIEIGSPSSRCVLYDHDVGYAGDRPDNMYYLADLRTGYMQKVAEGQFVAFGPDGKRYCTASPHDTSPFGGAYHGHQREVYTASLEVGVLGKGDTKEIVSGLVWVTFADWRKHGN